jgi:peptide/nickel transport system substrate-binding protein
MWITGEPSGFWPPEMTGQTDGQASGVALEPLFRLDKQSNLVPLLALDWKADATAKTITISLRKGVKFQDGSAFNADVCKWNLDQYRAGNRVELKKVTSVDVIDDYTIRLNLASFDNTIVTALSTASDAGRMISKQSFDANGGKAWASKNPVGTGPFQLVSWNKTVSLSWKRFDDYWDGKPYLDGIQMKLYADQTVALMDLKAGNIHILGVPDPRNAQALQASGSFNVVTPPEGQVPAIAGYAKDPASPFAKVEVRQALSYALDTKTMTENFGLGYWESQNQWALPGSSGYNPNIVGYPYNPQKAKDLLAKAGYPSGFNTTLSFWALSPTYQDESIAMQDYWKAVGINVTLNPVQRPAFADMASGGKGWIGLVREQGFSSPDPLIKFAGTAAGFEFNGVALPQEFIDTYNQAIAAPDTKTKQQLTWQLMSLSTDKYCMATYLYVQHYVTAKSKKLNDDLYQVVPYAYFSSKAWLSQ